MPTVIKKYIYTAVILFAIATVLGPAIVSAQGVSQNLIDITNTPNVTSGGFSDTNTSSSNTTQIQQNAALGGIPTLQQSSTVTAKAPTGSRTTNSSAQCSWTSNWDICAANVVYFFFVGLGSALAYMAAYIFSVAAQLSLSSTAYALDFLSSGWEVVRDIANMSFIFILVYLALTIMFAAEGVNTMKTLAGVIIIALVVNFSFFFTRVVIDAGNIVAVQFYNAIPAPSGCQSFFTSLCRDNTSNTKDLSAGIMEAIGVQTLLNNKSFEKYTNGGRISNDWLTNLIGLSFLYISVGVVFWILFITFLGVGIKFIVRIAVLWFVLVVSPLAFVAYTIKGTQSLFKKWWEMLVTHSIYPAVFLFVFLMLTKITTAMAGSSQSVLSSALGGISSATTAAGSSSDVGFIASMGQVAGNIGIRVALIVVVLYYGSKLADYLGVMGGSISERITGFATGAMAGVATGAAGLAGRGTAAAGGFAGRQLIGRPFNAFAQSETFKGIVNSAQRNKVGGGLWRGINRAVNASASASYDVRNVPGGGYVKDITKKLTGGRGINIGTAQGNGGFAAQSKEKKKTEEEQEKIWKERMSLAQAKKESRKSKKITEKLEESQERLKELENEVVYAKNSGVPMSRKDTAELKNLRDLKSEGDILASRVEKFSNNQITSLKAADIEGIIKQISEAHLKAIKESGKYSSSEKEKLEKQWHNKNKNAPIKQAEKQLEALNKIHEDLKGMHLNIAELERHAIKPSAGSSMVINLQAVDAMEKAVETERDEQEKISNDRTRDATPLGRAERTAAGQKLTRLNKAAAKLEKLREELKKVPEGAGNRKAPAEYERTA